MEAALEAAEAYAAMGGHSSVGATRTRTPKETRAGPVQMGAGMLAMPSRLVEKIVRDDYVDFAEFPPAAPEGVYPVAHMSDQVLIVQAADLRKSRRKISDIMVWARYFLLFIKVVEGYRPKRVPDLLGYMDIILRTSQRFPGLTWEDYDARFRQAVAGDSERQWATLDAGLYTECVTTQTGRWGAEAPREETRDWEHSRKRMRPRQEQPVDTERSMMEPSKVVCGKFNRYRGDCRFSSRCKFAHICSKCRGPHPVTACEQGRPK